MKITIDNFDGPLDLLLHLIKKSNIDIYDINITAVTNQYLEYLHNMQELNINVASAYLVMASELMVLKSLSLLPKESSNVVEIEEEEELKSDLIDRLVEYKKYKDVTPYFKNQEIRRHNFFIKVPSNLNYLGVKQKNVSDSKELGEIFVSFINRQKLLQPLTTKITTKELSVNKKCHYIKNMLKNRDLIDFAELISKDDRPHLIVTFLAVLELCKDNSIAIDQDENFANIMIRGIV